MLDFPPNPTLNQIYQAPNGTYYIWTGFGWNTTDVLPPPAIDPWDRLFTDIKINIPGAIDAVIQQELWRVVEDFLNQTNIWVEEIAFNVSSEARTYTINPVGKGSIERLLMVFDPENAAPDKRWVQAGITLQLPNTIHLMYAPSRATTWKAAVTKNIDDPPLGSNYPDLGDATWIISHYRDAFRYGTLGYLMLQPTKPYTNTKLGGYNWQNYVNERGKARTETLHGNVYGGQRWMYPQGFATTARKGWT